MQQERPLVGMIGILVTDKYISNTLPTLLSRPFPSFDRTSSCHLRHLFLFPTSQPYLARRGTIANASPNAKSPFSQSNQRLEPLSMDANMQDGAQ